MGRDHHRRTRGNVGAVIRPRHRARLKQGLADQPAVEATSTLIGEALVAATANDLAFNPVVPCRIVDTRKWTALTAGVPRQVYASGFDYSGQGGSDEDCGIPFGPTKAVMLNITTTGWDGRGNVNAWPYDPSNPPQPLSSIANFGQVAGLSAIANGISVPICDIDIAEDNCEGGDLFFQANGSNTNLVVDIVGCYTKLPGELNAGQVNGGTAYFWASSASPEIDVVVEPNAGTSLYAYNSEGGDITYLRSATGKYVVTFPGWGTIGHSTVTAYGAPGVSCQNSGWGGGVVTVACYDTAGAPADARFTVYLLGN